MRKIVKGHEQQNNQEFQKEEARQMKESTEANRPPPSYEKSQRDYGFSVEQSVEPSAPVGQFSERVAPQSTTIL